MGERWTCWSKVEGDARKRVVDAVVAVWRGFCGSVQGDLNAKVFRRDSSTESENEQVY